MLFSSTTFLYGFLTILIALYYPIKNIKIKNILLLIFSLIFYSWGEPKYIFLMISTVFAAYIFGILIDKNRENKKSKIYMILCITIILLVLFIFKYLDFSINILNIFKRKDIDLFNLSLPIGISFYSFQILSYIIDLYRDKVKLQKNYMNLLLYVSFFPQLIAGPIVRYETIEEEINNRSVTLQDFINGFKRLIIGLSKKVLIANNVAVFCDYVYSNSLTGVGSSILWVAAICYTLQIYFDFSGYSDMAIGLGKMFGFNFLENFDYPYTATSITNFWRKWHISLSSFFRDYIYIPLGGNRVKKLKHIRNILIVWGLTGLWHGANYNYIFWGLYYGILLICEKFLLEKILNKIPNFGKHIYSLFLIIIGWVIFRIEDIEILGIVLFNMFSFKKSNWINLFKENALLLNTLPYIVIGIIFSFPIYKKFKEIVDKSDSFILVLIEDLILGILFGLSIMYLVSNQYNPFIYFKF